MFAVAKIYAIEQAEKLNKLTMIEFFNYIHSTYYPNQDISFMEYFLELTQYEGECVVEHTKLIEYGIMTSEQSSDIKKKIDLLGLELEVDYLLRHVSERLESGTKHSKLYIFTPETFKKMLMRAQRRSNQRVDPVIYIDYYLLLEKVFKLYTDYSKVEYKGAYNKIIIICKKHGEFNQTPSSHLSGCGCPRCARTGFSKAQIEWLTFIETLQGIKIQHAMNDGEYKIKTTRWLADGYCKETNTVFEYHGDYWHGNPKKYDPEFINVVSNKKMKTLYAATLLNESKKLETSGII